MSSFALALAFASVVVSVSRQPESPEDPTPAEPTSEMPSPAPPPPSRHDLRGRVIDLGNGTIIPGAKVTVVELGLATTSDKAGLFSFSKLPSGSFTLRAEKPPFLSVDVPMTLPGPDAADELLEVGLIGEVESISVVEEAAREKPTPGGTQVVREEIIVVPGARGDMLTAVQSLPGIAQTGGFSLAGGLVIRGSGPADSRLFVDGVEVPLLFHFFNLQSILPSEVISDMVYAPGGFGVEYGRASGGIIEVRSRRGRPEFHGFAEISFINAGLFLQGPLLGPSRTSRTDPTFSVSARRSFIDAVLPAVLPDDADLSFTALPRYYDYQLRIDWQATDAWHLGVFLFGTDDRFDLVLEADSAADPALTGARFRNVTTFARAISAATYETDRVRSRTSLSLMTGAFTLEVGPDNHLRFDGPGLSVRNESRIRLLTPLTLRVGGETESWWFDTDVKFPRPPREGDPRNPSFTFDPPIVYKAKSRLTYLAGWTALDLALTSRLSVGAGLRYDGFLRTADHVFAPRGEARLALTDKTTVRAAGGLYTRPPDFNDEFAEDHLDPERAWQATLGVEHQLLRGVTLQATGFHTWRDDLIVFETNRLDPATTDRAYVNRGTGRSYGGEVFLQARGRRAFGWFAYTLSRSVRRDAPGASERLFDYDQTHNLVAVASWAFGKNERWRLGGRFQYTSGTPYTPITDAVFQSDLNYYAPEFGAVNSKRFEAQHQLDVRLDRIWQFRTWRLAAFLDVTNVYAHPAPLEPQYNHDYSEQTPITSIPILPAFGVRGEF